MMFDFNLFAARWKRLPLKWKILTVFLIFILIGLSTRSILLAIVAWGIIIFYAVKVATDLEI